MEGAPLLPEEPEKPADDNEKKEAKKKSKRRAGKLGLFAVEAEPKKSSDKETAGDSGDRAHERSRQNTAEAKSDSDMQAEIDRVAAETDPVPETEAPETELGQSEESHVLSQLAVAAKAANAEQAQNDDPQKAAADQAAEHFLDLVQEGKHPDEAEAETIAAIEAAETDAEETEASPETLDADETAESDAELPDDRPEMPENETISLNRPVSQEDAIDNDDAEPPAASGPPAGPPTGPPPTRTGGHQGGMPPFGAMTGPAAYNHNALPATPLADAETDQQTSRERLDDGASPAAMALMGGIIGYLIGRRRGRIKTEKKLLPLQKKLEKRVEDLSWQLRQKENSIRQIAAQKARQNAPAVIEKLAAAGAATETSRVREAAEGRRRAPEAHKLHGSHAQEKLGKMLVTAEARQSPDQRLDSPKGAESRGSTHRLSPEQRVASFNRNELLMLSEKIIVEGSSLRQMYETHLIGERGLRRLVLEHLRGGDLKQALRREVVEREIDFERDPRMRGQDGDVTTQANGAGGGAAAIDQLVQKAAAGIGSPDEQAGFYRARELYETNQQDQSKRRAADITMMTVIAGLTAIITYLLLRG